jgi:hypothetical protein
MPLPAGDGENGFLDLGDSEIPDLFQLDMRHVRHLGRVRGNVDGNLQPADDFSEPDLRRSQAAISSSQPGVVDANVRN